MTYCTNCKQPCNVVQRDFGIGPYEFWGSRGTNQDWHDVSDCCEAELIEADPIPDDHCSRCDKPLRPADLAFWHSSLPRELRLCSACLPPGSR